MITLPKISVILSVFNGQNYVREAIDSVLAQDYPSLELVVVDDGSTDGTASILKSYVDRIIVISQDNRGLGAGRNLGIRASNGDYLSFIDHDDCWAANKLSKQMATLLSSGDDPLVFSNVRQFICPALNEEESSKLRVPDKAMPGFIAGTLLLSRSRFNEVGEFFEINQVGEFVDWYLRAQEKNFPIKMIGDVLLHRRIHKTNMGRQPETYQRQGYLRILKAGLVRRRAFSKEFMHE